MRSVLLALALLGFAQGAAAKPAKRPASNGYTLVISRGNAFERMNYPSWEACQRAIASIKSQFNMEPQSLPGGGVLLPAGPPMLFCAPR